MPFEIGHQEFGLLREVERALQVAFYERLLRLRQEGARIVARPAAAGHQSQVLDPTEALAEVFQETLNLTAQRDLLLRGLAGFQRRRLRWDRPFLWLHFDRCDYRRRGRPAVVGWRCLGRGLLSGRSLLGLGRSGLLDH